MMTASPINRGRTRTSLTRGAGACTARWRWTLRAGLLGAALASTFEVRLVPAAALQAEAGHRDQLLKPGLGAPGAVGEHGIAHLLHGLELVATGIASVFVDRHGGNPQSSNGVQMGAVLEKAMHISTTRVSAIRCSQLGSHNDSCPLASPQAELRCVFPALEPFVLSRRLLHPGYPRVIRAAARITL